MRTTSVRPPNHNHETPSASHERCRQLFFRRYGNGNRNGRMDDSSSSTSSSDDGSEPDTAGSAFGSVADAGWSRDPSNPFSAPTQFRLGLDHQANPAPGSASSSRIDGPRLRSRLFMGRPHDANTVMNDLRTPLNLLRRLRPLVRPNTNAPSLLSYGSPVSSQSGSLIRNALAGVAFDPVTLSYNNSRPRMPPPQPPSPPHQLGISQDGHPSLSPEDLLFATASCNDANTSTRRFRKALSPPPPPSFPPASIHILRDCRIPDG
ncbi:hypothetical protein M422DRAFT_254866 [Sphaerobolus stellatus SS14]|uniref:Uncharacterized protein n=1 Tax=Sphaerobolus stellatus (strain SS14) TaxID=990650 RepID=A0A0C9V5H9_SPHS4|nr:hypothetical protein M422DRAFT_254866 [Sphaerobolus stellatus SS14]